MQQLKPIKYLIAFLVPFSFLTQSSISLIAQDHILTQTQSFCPTQQNSIVDDNLIAAITAIIDQAAYNTTRAQRPTTPDAPIVGPGAGCDLNQVLSLLQLIKNRIGCVNDPVCCNSILGILGNACEIFGPDNSISSILLEILNEINGTPTVVCTIPCAPTPITAPITITEPGSYCLAQDIVGTIIIAANNVFVDLNSHQITATSPGIQIQSGFYNISIRNGTIAGGTGTTGIEAVDSTDIEIVDINFIVDGVGITFNNIKNFITNNTQFTNYTNSVMSFTNSSNGKIIDSQIHNNNAAVLIPNLSLINLNDCQQLTFNNIVMTENSNIQTLHGITGINTHESNFGNIQITFNQTIQNLEGIHLENCDNNIIQQFAVNNNNLSSSTSSATLVGINITASVDGGSKNNSITECQIHDNTNNVTGDINSAILIGVNIAGTMTAGGITSNNAGTNTVINTTSIKSNTCTSQNNVSNSFLVGINLAGAINGGSIGAGACANCNITNCTVTQNNNTTQDGEFSTAQFIGINLAGIFSTINPISTGTIAANVCKNCHIVSCNVSNNNCSTANGIQSSPVLICINLASTFSFSQFTNNTINDNVCASCSISDCSLNNNSCSSNGSRVVRFFGISLSSGMGEAFTIGNNICAGCSIHNCDINNNNCANLGEINPRIIFVGCNFADSSEGNLGTNLCDSCSLHNCAINDNTVIGSGLFFGINFSRNTGSSPASGGNSCNNCYLDTISINHNTITNVPLFIGIAMNGNPATFVGGCNNITCNQCFIEGNAPTPDSSPGNFHAFFITSSVTDGGCNNIILKSCEVNGNSSTSGFHTAYNITGSDLEGSIGGARNIQIENCTAKQNTSSGSTFTGFHAFGISNALWLNCNSAANTTNGFLVQNSIDSTLRECEAFNNGTNGFNFVGNTRHVAIIDSQALGNLNDGFSFATTTTQCHIRNNIAQNNNAIGFNNIDGDTGKHQFFGNFTQGNGTNYSGIALVTQPNLITGPLANVET